MEKLIFRLKTIYNKDYVGYKFVSYTLENYNDRFGTNYISVEEAINEESHVLFNEKSMVKYKENNRFISAKEQAILSVARYKPNILTNNWLEKAKYLAIGLNNKIINHGTNNYNGFEERHFRQNVNKKIRLLKESQCLSYSK